MLHTKGSPTIGPDSVPRQIPASLINLEIEISDLTYHLGFLEERLQAVQYPTPEDAGKDGSPVPCKAPLAETIDRAAALVRRARERIVYLNSTVEV